MEELLKVSDFNLYIKENKRERKLLENLNFKVFPSEIVAIAGESGCGKSLFARSLLRLNDESIFRAEGEVLYCGSDINGFPESQMPDLRGKKIGIVFQEPLSFLNPTMRMGNQISEPLIRHLGLDKSQAMDNVEKLLGLMGIKNVRNYICQYPHQLSGGLAQRGMMASAVSCKPRLLIADEPTSALDVVSQAAIIKLIRDFSREFGISVIFITHDLELAFSLADRVAIMSKGKIVETGEIRHVFKSPEHDATKRLLSSVLFDTSGSGNTKKYECGKKDPIISLMKITGLNKYFRVGRGRVIKAVESVTLDIMKGETLGILGESGCGKSTMARILTRIIKPDSGNVFFNGNDINRIDNYPLLVQMVFQDPMTSLDPRMKVKDVVAEGLSINRVCKNNEYKSVVCEYLEKVGLDTGLISRFPHELSGGQRQRISIARSLIMKPQLLILDEPTSYLDTVSQNQILDLFQKMKEEMDLTYLFVTHSTKVLGKMCDRIAVMLGGKIVELGSAGEILMSPVHPYTVIFKDVTAGAATVSFDASHTMMFNSVTEEPSPNIRQKNRPHVLKTKEPSLCLEGCSYCGICAKAQELCFVKVPELVEINEGHFVACHYARV